MINVIEKTTESIIQSIETDRENQKQEDFRWVFCFSLQSSVIIEFLVDKFPISRLKRLSTILLLPMRQSKDISF